MNPVQQKADSLVEQFKEQTKGTTIMAVSQTQYCGEECLGTNSLMLDEVEDRIRGYTCEGFDVSWTVERGVVSLRISEE